MRANQLSAIPYLAAIFIGLYFFEMASFPFSIDEELAIARGGTYAHVWVGQGRWGAYLIEAFVLPRPIIPFLPVAMFGAGAILAYILLLDAARGGDKPLRPVDYLLFGLFAAYPTWYFLVEFYANLAAVGIGLGCAGVAVWLAFADGPARHPALAIALAACFGAFSIAVYQSYLLVIIAMGGAAFVIRLLESNLIRPWRSAAMFAAVVVLSLLLYLIGDFSFRLIYPEINAYFESLQRLDLLMAKPGAVLALTAQGAVEAYGFNERTFALPMWSVPIVVALGLASCVVFRGPLNLSTRLLCVLVALGILIVPFATHLVGGGMLPPRTLVAVPVAVWFCAYVATGAGNRWLAAAGVAASVLCLFQALVVHNTYQAASSFSTKQDFALATILNERISSLPEFDGKKAYALSVFGGKALTSVYPLPRSSTIGRSFFEWDNGSPGRITHYMRALGFPYYPGVGQDRQHLVIRDYANMPVFPAAGSVAIRDAIILVKLSDTPNNRDIQAMRKAGMTVP